MINLHAAGQCAGRGRVYVVRTYWPSIPFVLSRIPRYPMHVGLHILRNTRRSAVVISGNRHCARTRARTRSVPPSTSYHTFLHCGSPHFSVVRMRHLVIRPFMSHFFCPQSALPHTEGPFDDAAAPARNPFPFLHRPKTFDRDRIVVPRSRGIAGAQWRSYETSSKASWGHNLSMEEGAKRARRGVRKQYAAPRSEGMPFHSPYYQLARRS
jgi:hypothetical protein